MGAAPPIRAFDRARTAGLIVAVMAGTYALIRPDWAHAQNDIDPQFYTGVMLRPDRLAEVGADWHYVISRWTIYLPARLFGFVVGQPGGYLVYRALLVGVVACSLSWLLGPRCRRSVAVLVAVAVALQPVFVRAVFVDYSDAVVVPATMAFIVLAVDGRPSRRREFVMGVLAAFALIAQPVAAVGLLAAGAIYLWSLRSHGQLLRGGAVLAASVVSVGVVGLAYGWIALDMANIYRPTVDFMISSRGDTQAAARAGSSWWLGYRLWIYAPLLVLGVAVVTPIVHGLRWSSRESAVFVLCATQYLFHVAYQSAGGVTLEVHYYFSYMAPTLLLSGVTILARSAQHASARSCLVIAAALGVATFVLRDRPDVEFGHWIPALLACAGALVVALALAVARRGVAIAAGGAVVFGLFVVQVLPPTPDSIPAGDFDSAIFAGFDSAFASASPGPDQFVLAIELDEIMASIPRADRLRAGFLTSATAGPLSSVLELPLMRPSRWLNGSVPQGGPLRVNARSIIRDTGIEVLIVVGTVAETAALLDQVVDAGIELAERAVVGALVAGPFDLVVTRVDIGEG